MKIFNYSPLYCDRRLWHDIAHRLGLGGVVKDAELIERKELSVVIEKPCLRQGEELRLYGSFTIGRIDIYPCRVCTSGTIFHTFLGRLAIGWLLNQHEDLYFYPWTDKFSDRFSDSVFLLLGGRILKRNPCHRLRWPEKPVPADRLARVHSLLERLRAAPEARVKSFRFPRR